jgi:CubicO group peptidase (beta-lactamase class C family)
MLSPHASLLVAAVLSLVGVGALGASGPDEIGPQWRALDAAIRKGMTEWEVPGLSIAVIKGDQVVFMHAYGVKELGKPDLVDVDTVMAIGSTTKAMTATLIGMLVDEGRVGWDDPVAKHLPWFQLYDPWVTREVRLRDLLAHRVGVGGAFLPASTTLERREMLRRLRYLEPYASFRTRYDYSNVMYTAAGEVAAEITGKTWEDLLQARLLGPLGIKSAHPTVDTLWPTGTVAACFCCDLAGRTVGLQVARPGTNLAMPHMKKSERMQVIPWRHYANIGPAGGELAMSIRDMAQWVRFLVGKGVMDGKRLLSEKVFAEMHTPQNIIPNQEAPLFLRKESDVHSVSYGLGWRLNNYRGHRMSTHTGGVYGFMATVGLLPDDGVGVVVLANAERAGLAPALVLTVFDQQLGGPDRDWSRRVLAKQADEDRKAVETEERLLKDRRTGTSPPHPLETYAGTYSNPAYGEARIEQTPAGLLLQFPGAQKADLTHWHYDLFRLSLRGPMAYPRFATFRTGSDGKVASLKIEGIGEFTRQSAADAAAPSVRR